MILIDGIKKDRSSFLKIIDYFWGGFSGFAVVFLILAIWQVGSEFSSPLLLPSPKDVFFKVCEILKDYKNSEKWALIANELDSNNEESWIIFAKSKYNLKQKDDAISVLKIYNDKANSANIEDLMRQIEDDTAL